MDLIKLCKIYEGEREQKYPKYSSPNISDVLLPSPSQGEGLGVRSKTVTIYNLQFKKLETFSNKELFGRILMDISRVRGDFRQTEILELWKEYLLGSSPPLLNLGEGSGVRLGHFSAHVSSGTYIRSLVNDIGKTLGCGATTLSIKRTRVGDYKIEDSLKF
jgi:tRNA U55 pseudouridine synthase TruB